MDLGLTMLQRWWRQVYAAASAVCVPLMAAAIAAGWWFERAWLALLVIWWLKPLYDRVVLHVLSRAVFGELPTTRAVFGAAEEWLRTGLFWRAALRPLRPRALVQPAGAPARRPAAAATAASAAPCSAAASAATRSGSRVIWCLRSRSWSLSAVRPGTALFLPAQASARRDGASSCSATARTPAPCFASRTRSPMPRWCSCSSRSTSPPASASTSTAARCSKAGTSRLRCAASRRSTPSAWFCCFAVCWRSGRPRQRWPRKRTRSRKSPRCWRRRSLATTAT